MGRGGEEREREGRGVGRGGVAGVRRGRSWERRGVGLGEKGDGGKKGRMGREEKGVERGGERGVSHNSRVVNCWEGKGKRGNEIKECAKHAEYEAEVGGETDRLHASGCTPLVWLLLLGLGGAGRHGDCTPPPAE